MQQTHFTYNEASALTVNFNLTCFGLDFKNPMSRMIQQKPTDKRFCQSTPLVQKIAPQVLFEWKKFEWIYSNKMVEKTSLT